MNFRITVLLFTGLQICLLFITPVSQVSSAVLIFQVFTLAFSVFLAMFAWHPIATETSWK